MYALTFHIDKLLPDFLKVDSKMKNMNLDIFISVNLFVVYLTMLSLVQIMIQLLMNNELKKIWKWL
jgi:hypothetical protein